MAPLKQLALFVTVLAAMGGAAVSAEPRGHGGAVSGGRHLLAGSGPGRPLMPPMPGGGIPQQQGQGMGPMPPMMPGGGGNGGMPPLPPGQKPAAAFTINATLSLAGLTVNTFIAAAQNAFLTTLATTIDVPSDAVAINSIVAAAPPAGRRRLLQSGIVVAFGVVSPFQALANQTSAAIVTATTGSGATAFVAALNTALTTAGAPTCTSMSVVSQAVVAAAGGARPLAPPAPASHTSGASAAVISRTAAAAAATALLAALLA